MQPAKKLVQRILGLLTHIARRKDRAKRHLPVRRGQPAEKVDRQSAARVAPLRRGPGASIDRVGGRVRHQGGQPVVEPSFLERLLVDLWLDQPCAGGLKEDERNGADDENDGEHHRKKPGNEAEHDPIQLCKDVSRVEIVLRPDPRSAGPPRDFLSTSLPGTFP